MRTTGLRSEFVIKHLHRHGMVKDILPNGQMLHLWSQADDWISNQVFWRGWQGYEPECASLFFHLAAESRVTLDVGAFVGFYSILAGVANPRGQVYAFEPLPAIYRRLAHNIALNGLSNVHCINMAVGEQTGRADFFHIESDFPSSSSLSYNYMQSCPGLQASVVDTVRIDEFIEENGLEGLDLVKIDTETTEPQVLRGMAKSLRQYRPHIICEVLRGEGTGGLLEGILAPLGYSYYLLTHDGPQVRPHIEGGPEYVSNYLFTAKELSEDYIVING
jgi:FkbM family methyltransferase